MSKIATLEIEGKKYEFPIIEGTEKELGIDIKKNFNTSQSTGSAQTKEN
mgnify:CR=1 FL=1